MNDSNESSLQPTGIGVRNESSLHAALKAYLAQPGDSLEAAVDGYIVDILRGDALIEVQTSGLAAIRPKLEALIHRHPIQVAYPIATTKWIVHISPSDGRILHKRRSPKKGQVYDLFTELVHLPYLLSQPCFSLLVVMIEEEEIRCADGRGSWRRRGVSIADRRLVKVLETRGFAPADLVSLLPDALGPAFTNRELADQLHIPIYLARRITYCLRRAGALHVVGRSQRELLFQIASGA